MANFFGSGLGDVIVPTLVSPTVIVNPLGALPSLLADSILGGLGNDTIDGGGGADTVAGGAGDDTIRVRADTLPFFSGAGQFLGDAGNDRFIVTSVVAGTVIDGGTGTDTLVARANLDVSQASLASIEALALNAFLLTIRPDQLAGPVAIGADGTATIGNLALTTAAAATALTAAVTTLVRLNVTGTGVADALTFTTAAAGIPTAIALSGGGGADTLAAGAGADTLEGGDGADVIFAGDFDIARGGAQDDLIRADLQGVFPSGATVLDGGDGNDTLAASGEIWTAALVSVEAYQLDGSGAAFDKRQLEDFQAITPYQGATSGTITLVDVTGGIVQVVIGGFQQLTVEGTVQSDVLGLNTSGLGATDLQVLAGAGFDFVVSGAGDDTLQGGEDGDTLSGLLGIDQLFGEEGDDLLFVRNGDSAFGDFGDDTFRASEDLTLAATLDGGAGIDRFEPEGGVTISAAVAFTGIEVLGLWPQALSLSTAQLDPFLTIDTGNWGGPAARLTLTASGSAATEVVGVATLALEGSAGADLLTFSGTTPIAVSALAGADGLVGTAAADTLNGGAGSDTLFGVAGSDRLIGGGGDDRLIGGPGADLLTGGAGADRFRYDLPSEGQDRITDFGRPEDALEVLAAGFGGGLVAGVPLAPGQLVNQPASYAATAPSGTGQFVFNQATQVLAWDVDGAGGAAAVRVVRLDGIGSLATSDFVLV